MNELPLVRLLGNKLLKQDNSVQTSSLAEQNKYIGLYYSAFWCPSCIAFTPELVKFYEHYKKSASTECFEIVYVSSDNDEKQFKEQISSMPWIALPFADRSRQVCATSL